MKKFFLLILLVLVWAIVPLIMASMLSLFAGVGPVEVGIMYAAWLVVGVLIWRSQSKKLNR